MDISKDTRNNFPFFSSNLGCRNKLGEFFRGWLFGVTLADGRQEEKGETGTLNMHLVLVDPLSRGGL